MVGIRSLFGRLVAALVLAIAGAWGPLSAQSASEGSEKAVVAVVTGFIIAWNAHDAKALGQMFTEDCDFVGVGGRLWHSPAEISRVHAEQFAGRYDQSVFAVDGAPSVVFIKPDVALAHWRWTISGVRNTDESLLAPYSGIFT